ncbi:unnamed protein product [Sphagnum tenellum]
MMKEALQKLDRERSIFRSVGLSVYVLKFLGRHLMEVEVPRPMRYILGAVIMMLGVVLPVGYMMFRTKRVPSSSSTFAKQTELTERWRDS